MLRKQGKADKQGERDWGWCQVQKIEAVVADNQMIQHLGVFLVEGKKLTKAKITKHTQSVMEILSVMVSAL